MRLSRVRLLAMCIAAPSSLLFWHLNRTVWSMIEHREHDDAVTTAGRLPTTTNTTSESLALPREEFRKPMRRKLSKIYYVETDPSRTAFMEAWLSQQEFLPFEKVPIQDQQNHNDDTDTPLVDWREVLLSVLDTHNQSLPVVSREKAAGGGKGGRENNGLVLVLQDDFKIFDRTLGRMERALKWLPNDFDLVRLDCFQHGNDLVSEETRKDFVGAYATPESDAGGACPYHGGLHALVVRASRMHRIREALHAVPTPIVSYEALDCLLGRAPSSATDLRVYCLNFDDYHRIGCFHHLDPTADEESNEAQLEAMRRAATASPEASQVGSSGSSSSTTSSNNYYEEVSFELAREGFRYRYYINARDKNDDDGRRPPPLTDPSRFLRAHHRQPRILFGICSASPNAARRQAIRDTWGNGTAPSYFVVAGNWTPALVTEFRLYRDLLWVDTPEDYKAGLTPKTMAFLHFAAMHNEQQESSSGSIPGVAIDYAFKTDDDMFVNVSQLELDLAQPASSFNCSGQRKRPGCQPGGLRSFFGRTEGAHGPPIDYYGLAMEHTRPVRDNTSKFYVPIDYYPEEDFPPYGTGGGYALSRKFLACATREMSSMRHMWWEDVATGLLARTCGVRLSHANWDPDAIRAPGRFFEKSDRSQFSDTRKRVDIAHQVTIENQFRLHQGLPVIFGADPFKVALRCSDIGA